MHPVHMVAGRMWIDPAARPRKVTVVVENGAGDVRAEQMTAVKRKSGWRVYADWPLDVDVSVHFLSTGGPLDPRERDIVWAWGWKSKAAKALRVAQALI